VRNLLESEIFNARTLKGLKKKIEKHAETAHILTETQRQAELKEIDHALKNVAEAIEAGLLTDVLVARLKELEKRKQALSKASTAVTGGAVDTAIDTQFLLDEYKKVKCSPSAPAYKDYIRNFIERIDVGKYSVKITLKTGLDIFPEIDTTFEVRRQEIYERKKTV
jgi:hypothetical protein